MAEIQNQKNEKPAQPTDAKVAALGQSIDVGIHNLRDSNLFEGTQPFVIDTLRQEKMSEAIASQIAPIAITVGAGVSPSIAPTLASKLALAAENSGLDTKVAGALKNELEKRGDKLPTTEDGLRALARDAAEAVLKSRNSDLASVAKMAAHETLAEQKSDTRGRNFLEAVQDNVWYFLKKFADKDVNAPSTTRPNTSKGSVEKKSESQPVAKDNRKSDQEAEGSRSAKREEEPEVVIVVEAATETSKEKKGSDTVAA